LERGGEPADRYLHGRDVPLVEDAAGEDELTEHQKEEQDKNEKVRQVFSFDEGRSSLILVHWPFFIKNTGFAQCPRACPWNPKRPAGRFSPPVS